LTGSCGKKLPTMSDGLLHVSTVPFIGNWYCSNIHFMVIPPDREGEAAFDCWVFRLIVRVLQRTARQESLLGLVEGNRSKLLPVVHSRLLSEDLVERNLALGWQLATVGRSHTELTLTSLNFSNGTWISSAISLFPLKISPVRLQQHAGMAMLANTRSYSIRLRSNHIST
jgi:hypothetical protein